MENQKKIFGNLPSGEAVYQCSIKNQKGFSVEILTFGGAITGIEAADSSGNRTNVVLSYPTLEDYLDNPPYLGVTIGQTAGRIRNDRGVLLHGGADGLHQKNWTIVSHSEDHLVLAISVKAELVGEQGKDTDKDKSKDTDIQAGNVTIEADYRVLENDTLVITYRGTSEVTTYINLTNHSYFNLSGNGENSIENHILKMASLSYAPVDNEGVPLEGLANVVGTPFDFTQPKMIADALSDNHEQIKGCYGIDHPFKLDEAPVQIQISDPESKRALAISTNQAYAVVYSGNFLGSAKVPSGLAFKKHSGICFETQDIPDAPNRIDFKDGYLKPGQTYIHETVYCFEPKA